MKKLSDIAVVAVMVLLMVIAASVYLGPRLGYRADNVISDSMAPTISVNTMVVAHTVDPTLLKVGDIIAFRPVGIGDKDICHRIVQVVAGNPPAFRTQGDNANQTIDPWTVPVANVLGRVDFKAPLVGIFIQFLGTKIGLVVALIIPALIIFWLIFRVLWKELVRYIRSSPPKEG